MTASQMLAYFDQVQDKNSEPYFTSTEKYLWLNAAQADLFEELVGGGDVAKPVMAQLDERAGRLLEPFIYTATAVADASGIITYAALKTGASPSTGTVTLDSGASGSVDSITVNGVEIMSAAESFDTTLTITASNVADNINAFTSIPNYTASSSGAVITITDDYTVDSAGYAVVSTATTIATTDVNMTTVGATLSESIVGVLEVKLKDGSDYWSAKYRKPQEFQLAKNNSFLLGSASNDTANYSYSVSGLIVNPSGSTWDVVCVKYPADISASQDCEFPEDSHYKIVAKALEKAGIATEAEGYSMINQVTS